ncbi:MAG TPA: amino acid ABC transporter permease [Bacilli bacterium]|nr:amino acid ABC transporter permease [Bacilli bacterium]
MADFLKTLVETFPTFGKAALITVELTAVSLVLGTIIGLVFSLFKLSGSRVLRGIANVYVTIIRGTPLIVQLFAIYYGLVSIVDFGQFWSATIALAIHNGAYIAEIFRGGIQSIHKGQMEAARSLGMTKGLAMRRIILPQAFKRIVPALGNQFIIGLKDSSLAAFITMEELFMWAMRYASSTLEEMKYYTIAGIYYLVLVMIFTYLVHRLERRLAKG